MSGKRWVRRRELRVHLQNQVQVWKETLIKLKGKMKVQKPKSLSFNSSWDLSTSSGLKEPNDKVETLPKKVWFEKKKKRWKPLEKKFEFTINFVTCQEWEKSIEKEIVSSWTLRLRPKWRSKPSWKSTKWHKLPHKRLFPRPWQPWQSQGTCWNLWKFCKQCCFILQTRV